jgi:dihydrofolate reductase
MQERKVVLYIAMSVDGYIAGPDDSLDFLKLAEWKDEDYGYKDFVKTIDTVLWGRKTYDIVRSFETPFPYPDKQVYVLSALRSGKDEYVTYFNDIKNLYKKLKSEPGLDIYCDGGAQLIAEMLSYDMIDRFIISIIPHMLGSGTRLFLDDLPERRVALTYSKSYESGVVQVQYDRIR